MEPQELQSLAPRIDSGNLERRGLEEPLDELPIWEAVIHSQDMERSLCGHCSHGRTKRAELLAVFDTLMGEKEDACYEQQQKGRVVEERQVLGHGRLCLLSEGCGCG
uniref:Uncharacterized protein n=1 Tax=Arundo donax TaxID=35708 RepID=A0A0A9GIR0_ARUDO